MIASRVSDAQRFALFAERAGRLQAAIVRLQQQVASGRRLLAPEDDPLGAAQVVRLRGELAALAQGAESSRFGIEVVGAQDQTLADAAELLARAQEIAAGTPALGGPEARAVAREEVRGLLEALTTLANASLAGRRLFGGLALDAPPPFAAVPADPADYDPAAAYGGPSGEFWLGTGAERLRLGTDGGAVFGSSLRALKDLWVALAEDGDAGPTLAGLRAAHADLAAERAGVGVRQAALAERAGRTAVSAVQLQAALSRVQDADLAAVVAALAQAEAALQATLALGAHLTQPTLASLLAP